MRYRTLSILSHSPNIVNGLAQSNCEFCLLTVPILFAVHNFFTKKHKIHGLDTEVKNPIIGVD